ncbi:MAG: TIGR01440 family protein [Clostridia bacterium]|nr:TIGR01440 family protein [Clostridia bacterium]
MYETMAQELSACIRYLAKEGRLWSGGVVVLGGSTSEAAGGMIGKAGVPELGRSLAAAMMDTCAALGLRPAFQCCEHLNRALVVARQTLEDLRLTQVNVRPVPNAGGSIAAAAYDLFPYPAMAASIQADAAIDVGNTLVGMHIRPVAVPLRMEHARVGAAPVVMAYSRPPLIGGARARYSE